jgi:glycosyltransferase involved in cell wall biosynthesis
MDNLAKSKIPEKNVGKPIFFGPEIWSTQDYGGISRYFHNLISGISEIRQDTFAFLPTNGAGGSKSFPNTEMIHVDKLGGRSLINTGLNRLSKETRGGIYHSTFYGTVNYKFWRKNGFLNVVNVHDLIIEKFPIKKTIKILKTDQKKRAIKSADHIICISNTTKNELLKFYEIPDHKVSVIYLGCDSFGKLENSHVLSGKKSYLLYVGNRGSYKNFDRFVKAYSYSNYLRNNFNIIAFGGGPFTQNELELFDTLNIRSKVKFMFGPDKSLVELYSNAAALIYPSLDEGFGFPPLEAMSLGCPVIASNQGSIPEICKENIIYFDPYNVNDISETIEEALSNSALLERNIVSGKAHSKNFSWAHTIQNTNILYDKLLSHIE